MDEDWRLKAMLEEELEAEEEEGLSLGEAREVRARVECRGREESVRRSAVAGISPMVGRDRRWGC